MAPQPKVVAILTITLLDNGQVNVSGPIENRMLTYGLLGVAQDSIREHAANQDKRIQMASANSPFAKKGANGT